LVNFGGNAISVIISMINDVKLWVFDVYDSYMADVAAKNKFER